MPLPACAEVSPLLVQDPSVYIVIGGLLVFPVLGALWDLDAGGGMVFVKTLMQSLRVDSILSGFSVSTVSFVASLCFEPTSFGSGWLRCLGGWNITGFHFSFIVPRRPLALSMHLLGCLQLPFMSILILTHFVHLHILFFLWFLGVFSDRITMSFMNLTACLFRMHLPYLSLRLSGLFCGLLRYVRRCLVPSCCLRLCCLTYVAC